MTWNHSDIERLKNKGFRVKLTSAPKDRIVEVVSNGKVEKVKFKKVMEHEESQLQQNCVRAFRMTYPELKKDFFPYQTGLIQMQQRRR